MRVLDNAEAIAERIAYRGYANAFADIGDSFQNRRTQFEQTCQFLIGIIYTPVCLCACGSRFAHRN